MVEPALNPGENAANATRAPEAAHSAGALAFPFNQGQAGGKGPQETPSTRDETEAHAPSAEPQSTPASAGSQTPVLTRKEGNRLVGTAWALLAAGLFQVVYFGLLAGLVALLALPQFGAAQVGQIVSAQLSPYFGSAFAWLPVLFFFLFFELTVLIFNRAGRFFYVVASLIVGVLTYVVSVLLITIQARGSIGDTSTLEQMFLLPQFVLLGLAAREVMLWTGVAIGSRGVRVRRRNRARRKAYLAETGGGTAA